MFKRTAVQRTEGAPTGLLSGVDCWTSPNGLALHVRGDALAFRIALVGVAVWFVSLLDLDGLMTIALDSILGIAAIESLIMRPDLDEAALIVATRSGFVFHAISPGARSEVVALFAAIIAVVLVIGRATVLPLADKLARRRAFVRRMDARDTPLHYSCDQFWLRTQGR